VHRVLHLVCVATAAAFLAVGPGALLAAGDDGPTRSAATDRPTRTILRPTEITDAAPARASDKTVIVLVLTFCVLPSLLVVFLGPPLLSLVR
jgi:hypothetical protein